MTLLTPQEGNGMVETTRVKVTVSRELKDALEQVAEYLGMPLSRLLVEAAVDRYLLRKAELPKDLGHLCDRIRALEKQLDSLDRPVVALVTTSPPKAPRKARKSILDPVQQVLPGKAPSAMTEAEVAIKDGIPLHIDRLVERLTGGVPTLGLKANLSQVGGRDGKLFQGDISKAQRVAEFTSALDPDGLPWLPVDKERRFWTSIAAFDYCRGILGV
jgi:hypothetical protein